MRQIPGLAPPPDEQAAIVRFLDYATGRLERAIRAKGKVVALLHEQRQIVEWIAEESKTLNTAINRLDRETSLLREYRTRLVADVVTGKLDVRPAARQLPEEAGEHPGDLSDSADESGLSDEMPLE